MRKIDRNGNVFTYAYDALGRVVSTTDGEGNEQTFTYDKNGRITAVTDGNGNTTKYVLDGNGNVVQLVDAKGHSSFFAYDSMDRMTQVRLYTTDKADSEQVTLYSYDTRGLVTKEVNAVGDSVIYLYDGNGNLIQKTDEDGYVTEYEYSPVNLVSAINYDSGKTARYAYNGTGELVQLDDWTGTTTYSRDLLNRLTQVTDPNDRTVGYTWDNVGNQLSVTYPDGTSNTNGYDAENRLVSVTDYRGKTTEMTYDANGNQTSLTYANGEAEKMQYDGNDRLVQKDEFDPKGIQRTVNVYTYDANGNKTGEMVCQPQKPQGDYQCSTDGQWGTPKTNVTYSYDELNQLVGEKDNISLFTTAYTYDALGNLLKETESKTALTSSSITYTYNKLNQLVTKTNADGTTRYQYDKQGNRVQDKLSNWFYSRCATYTYDDTNRLVQGTAGTSTLTSEYVYNGLGVRVQNTQTDQKKASIVRDFVIDYTSAENNDLMVYGSGFYEYGRVNGELFQQKNVYAGDKRIEMQYTQNADVYGNGALCSFFYTHEDEMGSTVRYSKEDGSTYEEHVYDAWGAVQVSAGYLNDSKLFVIEANFTGHPYDSVLGAYFAEARFYDATNRTWMAEDPIKSGLNWYKYCYNNPTSFIDPTGLIPYGAMPQYFAQMGCLDTDNSIPYAAAQQGNVTVNPEYQTDFLSGVKTIGAQIGNWWSTEGKIVTLYALNPLLQILAFVGGTVTALVEDVVNGAITGVNVVGQVGGSLLGAFAQNGQDGLTTVSPEWMDTGNTGIPLWKPEFDIPAYYQASFSAGRVVGHLGTIGIGLVGLAVSLPIVAAGIFGGAALVPATGGASAAVASVPVAVGVAGTVVSVGIAAVGIGGLLSDPNIQFSVSNNETGGNSETVTSNQGNEIDITPNENHTTTNRNPGYKGEPNSSLDILDKDGNVVTRRWFDENGNAIRDVDMTNHGNPKQHPEWPHEHFWEYGPDGKPIGR